MSNCDAYHHLPCSSMNSGERKFTSPLVNNKATGECSGVEHRALTVMTNPCPLLALPM